jgi:hypothetical protein
MRPAKLLEFPSLWVLIVGVVSATITVFAVSDQAWPFFAWTEWMVGHFNGQRRLLEPLALQGCDPKTIRAIAAAGVLTFVTTAGSTVVAVLAMLDFAAPAYRPRKPLRGCSLRSSWRREAVASPLPPSLRGLCGSTTGQCRRGSLTASTFAARAISSASPSF